MGVLNRTKEPRIDPATLYVCLSGHVSKAGSYPEGTRLRGTDPGVLATPHLWADAGLDDAELNELRAARGLLAAHR